jgi:threonine dehydrogenase-like Zn-dependent dehydrogenase
VKAFLVERPGVHRVVEMERPRIREDEVLLRVKAATICHSDQQILRGQRTEKLAFPLVPGHEFAGIVEGVGSYVRHLEPGDTVACEGMAWCGRCPACRDGRTGLCANYDEMGCTRPGGFAEMVAVPARCCHPAPGIPFESLAAAEPAANALAAVEAAGIEPGDTLVVIGVGPIALLAMQIARARHPGAIIAVGTRDERLARAAELGATACVNARTTDPAAEILRLTRGEGVRRIIQCGPTRAAFELALAVAGFDATVAIEAAPDEPGSLGVPMEWFVARHLTLAGVTGYTTGGYRRVVEMIRLGAVDPSRVISHRFPLARIEDAFALLDARREGVLKVAILP